ncbi:MAG: phosphonate C-P lyase system protein PhnH [Thalassovita sp.]
MHAAPTPSLDESRANRAFYALLTALSQPGKRKTLPSAGEDTIVEALLDRECRVSCADPTLMPKILATGAMISKLPQADHVFGGHLQSAEALMALSLGSDLYPDEGATVILRASLTTGPKLRLSGPGIETTTDVSIGGLPEGFWQMRQDLIRYPMGFDLFFVDGDQVLGVPRSTLVEEL